MELPIDRKAVLNEVNQRANDSLEPTAESETPSGSEIDSPPVESKGE
jgi:hypothetical protein